MAEHFSKELNTRIEITKVDISFFDEITLTDIIVYEQTNVKNPDTLVYLGKANVKLNNLFFLKDSIRIYRLEASQIYVNARRTEKKWNFDFISDYFGGEKKSKKSPASKPIVIRPEKIHLSQLRLHQRDGWYGEDMLVNCHDIKINFEKLDFLNEEIQ